MMKKHFKKFVSLALTTVMVMGIHITSFGSESESNITNALQEGYNQISIRAKEYNIPFSMTFDEYVSAFDDSGFNTTKEYADAYLGILEPNISTYGSSSGSDKWYYNIGTTLPSDAEPEYDTYNLYDAAKKGDIIYEDDGGFGVTGHIAIIEGKYYDAVKRVNYIRIIEAIEVGVVRSCIDDRRVEDKKVTLLRVSGATIENINNAVSFCVDELGSSYRLDFQKDTSSSETDWYCSELVWAAYKNQGIDIEVRGNGEPGITPHDILNSSKTTTINLLAIYLSTSPSGRVN